jgi:hypothetical protein
MTVQTYGVVAVLLDCRQERRTQSPERSRSAGLNDHIQALGERAKRQRGATKERIFLPQIRQFG